MSHNSMNSLGIPQDRIAKRLGQTRETVRDHLAKMAVLPNPPNADLSRGFTVSQVAEKHACPACPVAPADGTGIGLEDRTGGWTELMVVRVKGDIGAEIASTKHVLRELEYQSGSPFYPAGTE